MERCLDHHSSQRQLRRGMVMIRLMDYNIQGNLHRINQSLKLKYKFEIYCSDVVRNMTSTHVVNLSC